MTLIVYVPCRDGLLVAADSRLTVGHESFCDGVEKLISPNKREHTLVAVTGRRGFFHPLIYGLPDVCKAIRTTPREFDLGFVARDYMDASEDDLEELNVADLADHCVSSLVSYLAVHPHWLPKNTGEAFGCGIHIACYKHEARVCVIRGLEIKVTPDLKQLKATLGIDVRFPYGALSEPVTAGEGGYLQAHVLPNLHKFPVGKITRDVLGSYPKFNLRKVCDLASHDAAELATDLIASASRMTRDIPAGSGIGGPVDVRLIGAEPAPLTMRPTFLALRRVPEN